MQNSCQRSKKGKENLSLQTKKIKKITHHHQSLGFQVLFPFPVETKMSPCQTPDLTARQSIQWLNMSCYPSLSNLLYCFSPDYSKMAEEACCYLWPNTAMLDKANTAKDIIDQYPQISLSSYISFIQSSHGAPSDLSCNLSYKKSCFSVLHC